MFCLSLAKSWLVMSTDFTEGSNPVPSASAALAAETSEIIAKDNITNKNITIIFPLLFIVFISPNFPTPK